MIVNDEHKNFKRLYWSSNKEQIKNILSTVNEKYLRGMFRRLQRNPQGKTAHEYIAVILVINFN